MAWSIFTQGGGPSEAKGWAEELLRNIGAPVTPGNVQFVYDWEESEGGGGIFNPLNQGPVPGQPQLTTSGQQYGGGAANFASWGAGLQGASDYLHMSAYSGVLSALRANNPVQARSALWNSPWAASHYGYGAAWSNAAVPGGNAVLPPASGGGSSSGGGSGGAGGGGGVQTAQLDAFFGSNSGGVLAEAGALLHGTAVVLDRIFGLFAPGQGWRAIFWAVTAAAGFGSWSAFHDDGDSDGDGGGGNLPLAIALLGVASVSLFMAARPWPQTSGGPIRPGAYVVDVLTGQPPPAGPQGFSQTEVHLTEAGLGALLGLWAAGKAAGAAGGIAGAAGGLGGIIGKVWGWIKGLGSEAEQGGAEEGAAAAAEGVA